jgi:hypothetical protein
MSWQDELRRLDAELATGKISLHQHRKQRDELLAAASGGFAPSPVASPLSAPQWPTDPPPEAPPNVSAALLASDRPTSAPSPADERPTDSIRYPSFEDAPTVITRPVSPGAMPGLMPPQRRPNLPEPPDRGMRPARRVPTWLFLSLGVLLVLALVIGGSWWLGDHGNSQTVAPTPIAPSPAPTAPAGPPLEAQLPTLPGVPDVNNSTVSVEKGVQLGLYPQQAADTFTRNGVKDVVYRGSVQGNDVYFVLAIQTGDPNKAKAVVDYLHSSSLSGGFAAMANNSAAVTGTNGGRLMNGTWYASDGVAVAIWVSQPASAHQPTRLSQHLDQTESAVQKTLPRR